MISGYQTDSSADVLTKYPIFQSLLAKKQLASQPSISRFWDRLSQVLLDKVRTARNTTKMIFDLDSTHSDSFEGLIGNFLKAELRSGRKTVLKLSSYTVYQELFHKILWNIQHFKWQ